MTAKQQSALNTIIAALPEERRESYAEAANCAIALGYMPAIKGARGDYADFTNAKLKKTILKINANPDFTGISMKFFALEKYGGVFESAIEDRLKTWKRLGYEAKCFGCGKCDGTQGYNVDMPDGSRGFLCGFSLLPAPSFKPENVEEIKTALRKQHEFFAAL